jgi:hypothetical protein
MTCPNNNNTHVNLNDAIALASSSSANNQGQTPLELGSSQHPVVALQEDHGGHLRLSNNNNNNVPPPLSQASHAAILQQALEIVDEIEIRKM